MPQSYHPRSSTLTTHLPSYQFQHGPALNTNFHIQVKRIKKIPIKKRKKIISQKMTSRRKEKIIRLQRPAANKIYIALRKALKDDLRTKLDMQHQPGDDKQESAMITMILL